MNSQKLIKSLILVFVISVFSTTWINGQVNEKKQDLDLVFIGNSITQGAFLQNRQLESPPAVASEYLRKQPGVGNVDFSNQGKSGYTTVDFLPSGEKTFSAVIAATHLLHTDNQRLLVFSISLGTNDSAEQGPNGSPVAPKDYHNNLKSISDQLLADFPDCKIILEQPIWYSPNTYNRAKYMAEGLARLQTYFPELQSLVAEYSKSKPGHVFMGDQKGFEYFQKNYLTDLVPEKGNAGTFYLHPTKNGSAILGQFWGGAIYQRIFKN